MILGPKDVVSSRQQGRPARQFHFPYAAASLVRNSCNQEVMFCVYSFCLHRLIPVVPLSRFLACLYDNPSDEPEVCCGLMTAMRAVAFPMMRSGFPRQELKNQQNSM